ncbi:MAG: hypothetical protein ACAI43_21335 [Phycisphaerae bacterium]|nr:hypothetical protein [Tepidisphaeraceae bacterium]
MKAVLRSLVLFVNVTLVIVAMIAAALWVDSYWCQWYAFHTLERQALEPVRFTQVLIHSGRVEVVRTFEVGTYGCREPSPTQFNV